MSDRYKEILELYTSVVIKKGDYSQAGLESAFNEFCDTLTIPKYEYKPPKQNIDNNHYVKTTLAEAIQRAKLPVMISVEKNKYGNWESTVYPGLIFKEINVCTDPKHPKMQYVCIGFQDGEKIAPLSMNQLRICQANGWMFDTSNTVGCAKTVSSDLAV